MLAIVDYRRSIEAVIPGVQGRVLGVLARTNAELTMRTVAQLAGVSAQQASVVLNRLSGLGIVARRDAGASAMVRLERDNEASRAVIALAELRTGVLKRLHAEARRIKPAPASLIVFGSFARGLADAASDVDVVVVRPLGIGAEHDRWTDTLGRWRETASRVVGNPVSLIELSDDDLANRSVRRGALWHNVEREGVVLVGARLLVRRGQLVLGDDAESVGEVG